MRNSARYTRNTCTADNRCDRYGFSPRCNTRESVCGAGVSIPGTKTGTSRLGTECLEMQKELMALYFVMVELELYLDGHPDNQEALARYRCISAEYDAMAVRYEKQFGPLLARNIGSETEWKWVKEPWPWEV